MGLSMVAGATCALCSWSAQRLMGRGIGRAAAMGSVLVLTGAPLLATPQAFAVGAYMALVPMFLGYVLFGLGLTRISASTATTLTLAEPAVAAVLAVLVVGERLPLLGWLGIAVIGLSLLILALAPSGREVEPLAVPDVATTT
ncbi:DMT family transporter [Brachybacterium paraconglomeratum]|uniref:DMT family transporter n=1 Tax=Brachybacterium paraconglomeratum TaxID=173362 RepID=UPI0037F1443D